MQSKTYSGIVTFTTDFGLDDGYAGVMKGVVLSHFPQAILVDVSHGVPAFNLRAASLVLESSFSSFPKGTVHVVVVDPGVGSSRRHLLVKSADHFFIGPDNGIPGRIGRLHKGQAYQINPDRLGSHEKSKTFHGRDIYAYAAGRLLAGVEISDFTSPVSDPLVLTLPEPLVTSDKVEGEIIYADHFGNLVTNLKECHLTPDAILETKGIRIKEAECYSCLAPGIPGAILNSWGYFEIALREASASRRLGIEPGEKVFAFKPATQPVEKKEREQ